MTSSGFAYPNLFGKNVPPPAPRWAGNAKYNFIGGHNDRALIPVEELIAALQDSWSKYQTTEGIRNLPETPGP